MWLRWIIILLIGWVLYRWWRRRTVHRKLPKRSPPTAIQDEMVQDPVCQVYVPKGRALTWKDPKKGMLYFCSPQCRDQYLRKEAG